MKRGRLGKACPRYAVFRACSGFRRIRLYARRIRVSMEQALRAQTKERRFRKAGRGMDFMDISREPACEETLCVQKADILKKLPRRLQKRLLRVQLPARFFIYGWSAFRLGGLVKNCSRFAAQRNSAPDSDNRGRFPGPRRNAGNAQFRVPAGTAREKAPPDYPSGRSGIHRCCGPSALLHICKCSLFCFAAANGGTGWRYIGDAMPCRLGYHQRNKVRQSEFAAAFAEIGCLDRFLQKAVFLWESVRQGFEKGEGL